MVCAIGPAAGCGLYEVGQDVIDAFAENFAVSQKYFTATRLGHALVDLKSANRDQLIESGVLPKNISISAYCTMERVHLFFSYRIEKNRFGRTGSRATCGHSHRKFSGRDSKVASKFCYPRFLCGCGIIVGRCDRLGSCRGWGQTSRRRSVAPLDAYPRAWRVPRRSRVSSGCQAQSDDKTHCAGLRCRSHSVSQMHGVAHGDKRY